MESIKFEFPGVQTICWCEDHLVDWVSGCMAIELDGAIRESRVSYGYKFNAAVQSSCGRYAVIYEKCGTKGLVLRDGEIVREINRSYYHADVYEYPLAIYSRQNEEPVLAHCPDGYNVLVLEELVTGKPLIEGFDRESPDYFHSRLTVSSDGNALISAGWVWHPFDCLEAYDISQPLESITRLDSPLKIPRIDGEVSSADFIDSSRILVCTSQESLDDDDFDGSAVGPSSIAVINIKEANIESIVNDTLEHGTIYVLDGESFLSFYEYPKQISIRTGEVIRAWNHIDSGKQLSSILMGTELPPSIAVDRDNRRFAVAGEDTVSIVTDIPFI